MSSQILRHCGQLPVVDPHKDTQPTNGSFGHTTNNLHGPHNSGQGSEHERVSGDTEPDKDWVIVSYYLGLEIRVIWDGVAIQYLFINIAQTP